MLKGSYKALVSLAQVIGLLILVVSPTSSASPAMADPWPPIDVTITAAQTYSPMAAPGNADLVLHNGKVVTADREFSVAQAVAIRDGRFLAVGSDEDVLPLAGPNTRMIDLEGQTVLPGLIDSHAHIEAAGEALLVVDFSKSKNIPDAMAAIEEWAAKTKPGEWIIGGSWRPLADLQEKRFPNRWEIDAVAPNNPVFLPAGHTSAANSYALRLAGITKDTRDPEGGRLERDPGTGEPNGVLDESAQDLVKKAIPPTSLDQLVDIRKKAMAALNSYGLTSAVVGLVTPEAFKAFERIWLKHEQTVRLSLMYAPVDGKSATLAEYEKAIKASSAYLKYGDDWLNFSGIKILMDGGMTLRTAYMREPYPDDPSYNGWPVVPPEKLNQLVAIANRNGWRVGVHAVGDAAIDKVLDAYENASKEKSIVGRRFIVIHGSLMLPDQMERAKRLGVRVDSQNIFMWGKASTTERFLGTERANRAIPTRWLIDYLGIESTGAGTDYSVNPINPFINMYVAITRKDSNGVVWGEDQAITREEAIRLYTNGSAAYSFHENVKGSIEPGKLADLVVISDDILTVPDEAIKGIEALTTIVGGKIVYQRQ